MIADTTFLSQFLREARTGGSGPARNFFAARRRTPMRTTIINVGEVAVWMDKSADAWEFFKRWTIYRLTPGVALAAADLDRRLIETGERLGENDNWIAGFALYYREPLISLDAAFDRVPGLRRITY